MDTLQQLRQDFNELQIKVNSLGGLLASSALPPNVTPLSPISTNFRPLLNPAQTSAVQQIRNGDFSHSVNTWFDAAPAPGTDKVLEAAWWFSNDAPTPGQQLDFTNSETSSTNQTLKMVGHSTYDPAYSDWDGVRGVGRFEGLTTIDAPLVLNSATPGKTECLGMILAKRNPSEGGTVSIPDSCLIYAGIWDNTTGQLDWLHGSTFALNASVRGTPAGTTERRYKIFGQTDRGYTFLSTEVILANAPNDASFTSAGGSADVYLTWTALPGVLIYNVYRHDVVAGKFRLLESIGNGANSYADNGSINVDDDAGGYPSASNAEAIAYVASYPGVLSQINTDGVDASWTSFFLNIPIPATYDQSLTTGNQVLRIGLTEPLARYVTDAVVVNGDNTVTSATAMFTASDVGLTVTLTSEDGLNETVTTIASVTNDTEIELTDAPDWDGTNATLFIESGGDHGLLVDLCHLSYVPGAVFGPYVDDLNRTLQPTATPNGSSQGGVGTGGGNTVPGEGGIACVALDQPIIAYIGERLCGLRLSELGAGELIFNGDLHCNRIDKILYGSTTNLVIIRTWNGVELQCSPSHPIITGRLDTQGRPAGKLKVDDFVLTVINGRIERSRIKEVIHTQQPAEVGMPRLTGTHLYAAGKRYAPTLWHRAWFHVKHWFKSDVVGIMGHNAKNIDGLELQQ